MKSSVAVILVVLITGLTPSVAFAQRSGARGGRGAGTGAGAGSNKAAEPSTNAVRPPAPGSAYRTLPPAQPVTPRGVRAGRGLPYLWWWGYVDYPDTLDTVEREEIVPLAPSRPAPPPAESSLIQPMLTLPRPQPPATARGNLRLEVAPNSAQVYVDGFYVGTVEEISRLERGLDVAAGWHRLEFRAPGYMTPAANVTIETDRTLTYRTELRPLVR